MDKQNLILAKKYTYYYSFKVDKILEENGHVESK